MGEDGIRDSNEDTLPDDTGVDWKDYVFHEESEKEAVHLDATDYAALFVAALETVFLPLVILGVMLLVIGLIFRVI